MMTPAQLLDIEYMKEFDREIAARRKKFYTIIVIDSEEDERMSGE